jgi:hypothetical protein
MIGAAGVRIWLATAAVDGRKGFDTLCGIVRQALGHTLYESARVKCRHFDSRLFGGGERERRRCDYARTGRHYALITIVPPAVAANQTGIALRRGTRSKYLPDSASKSVAG